MELNESIHTQNRNYQRHQVLHWLKDFNVRWKMIVCTH